MKHPVLKGHPHQALLFKAQGPTEEEAGEPEMMNDSKETVPSGHKTGARMNSHGLWQHSQGLHKFRPDGVLVSKKEKDKGFHS